MDNKFLKDNLIARWLDNRLNDDEKESLETSGELDDLKIVLDDISTWEVKKMDTKAGLEALNKRKKLVISPTRSEPKQQNRSWLRIAASIIILVTGSYFGYQYFSNPTITIQTEVAESKTIQLPDGSTVNLDAVSTLSYKKKGWEQHRTLTLNGQAFFNVTKGSTFKVNTNTGSITVLGTQFNVKATQNTFEVTCYEGKVAVNYNNEEDILTTGQSAIVKNNKLVSTTHTTNTPEWVDGYEKYNKTPLLDVVKDLERYYNTQITLPKEYENLQFTGTITYKDLNLALETLFTSMEINYTLDENNSVTFQ